MDWIKPASPISRIKANKIATANKLKVEPLSTHHRFVNLIGKTFDRLLVIAYAGSSSWWVQCKCGTIKILSGGKLNEGIRSCGCLAKELHAERAHGLVGTREHNQFRTLDSIQSRNKIPITKRWTGQSAFKTFLEDVGECPSEEHVLQVDRAGFELNKSTVRWVHKSEKVHGGVTHGYTNTPTYNSWRAMMERCYNSNSKSYQAYGGAGITVCERWHSFLNFLDDMGERPPESPTIDRIKNNKGYYLNNCRWASRLEQRLNQDSRVNLLTHKGETKCLQAWSVRTGIPWATLKQRMQKGLSSADILSTRKIRKVA